MLENGKKIIFRWELFIKFCSAKDKRTTIVFQRQPSEITHVVQWSEGIFANVSSLSSAIIKTNIELKCERVLGFLFIFWPDTA